MEPPQLLHPEATQQNPIDVFQIGRSLLIVSDRAKQSLASIDGEAFEFVEARCRFEDGSPAPTMWLADVVRFVDASDEEKSDVYVRFITNWQTGQPVKRVSHQTRGAGFFYAAALNDVHVFRPLYSPFSIFLDDAVVAAAQQQGWIGFDSWFVGIVDCASD